MKNLFCLSVLLLFFHLSYADDGTFYSRGGNIFPLQVTDIQLKKQDISFQYIADSNGYMHVQVSFHFFNPTEAKDLLVGFVSPGVSGADEPDTTINGMDILRAQAPVIWNFSVAANETVLPFDIKYIDTIKNKSAYVAIGKYYNGYYIYLFKVHFNKGWNEVNHVYDFKGDVGVGYKNLFSYYFRTGKTWANRKIDEINISISGLKNCLLVLPHNYSYPETASYNWRINGIGKREFLKERTEYLQYWDSTYSYNKDFFFIRDATIAASIVNFTPDFNFDIAVHDENSFFYAYDASSNVDDKEYQKMHGFIDTIPFYSLTHDSLQVKKDLTRLSKEDLQFAINYVYSWAGYPFKKPELKELYDKMIWYIPDYAITDYKKDLNTNYRLLLELLLEEQKRRKL